jgi:hypothetical protein
MQGKSKYQPPYTITLEILNRVAAISAFKRPGHGGGLRGI